MLLRRRINILANKAIKNILKKALNKFQLCGIYVWFFWLTRLSTTGMGEEEANISLRVTWLPEPVEIIAGISHFGL